MQKKRLCGLVRIAGLLGILVALQGCPLLKQYCLIRLVAPLRSGALQAEPAAALYREGAEVTLTALPAKGWRFDCWIGPVADTGVPVTTVTISKNTVVTARFVEAAPPEDATATLDLDENGEVVETVSLAITGGSSLDLPAGIRLSAPETGIPEGPLTLTLSDRDVSGLPPVSYTNWIWAFEVAVGGGETVAMAFSSLTDATVVDPDYAPQGASLSAPLGQFGIETGAEAVLYRFDNDTADDGAQDADPVFSRAGRCAVDDDGMASFSVFAAGTYAIGVRPYTKTGTPDLGMLPLYDCVVEAAGAIDRIKVIEDSTAEIFNVWLFTDITPGQMPETTDWVVRGMGDEPCMGRLENYGKRFRLRSPYANAFVASYGLQQEDQAGAAMSGPYAVDASGEPAATPIANPYDQCDYRFAGEVKVVVLSRAGDWSTFTSEVVQPLRDAYDKNAGLTSNVKIQWFRKLKEGYYAELWVRTAQCTGAVANAAGIVHEEGVSIAMLKGRLAFIVDWRGGGPYVAVYGPVAHNTGVGLRFYDPFWDLESGILDEHSLGGPDHMMFGMVDAEYDAVHDSLWIIYKDADGVFNLFRYDKPIYNFGDRPPDAAIDAPSFGLQGLYDDPDNDRLFVHDFDPGKGPIIDIYAHASSTPVLENSVDHVAYQTPVSNDYIFIVDYLAPKGDMLYLLDSYTHFGTPTLGGLEVRTYDLTATDNGARFRAWAAFGDEKSAPITKGVYSRANDILYAGTDVAWNGHTSVFAIDSSAAWQSTWVVTDPDTGDGYWSADQPDYRAMTWAGAGSINDLDIVEGNPELLVIAQHPTGDLNQTQVYLFTDANKESGIIEPFYCLALDYGVNVVELINPPAPTP